jgi:hypothetical protein
LRENRKDERFDSFIASHIADVVEPVTGRKAFVKSTTVGTARKRPTSNSTAPVQVKKYSV